MYLIKSADKMSGTERPREFQADGVSVQRAEEERFRAESGDQVSKASTSQTSMWQMTLDNPEQLSYQQECVEVTTVQEALRKSEERYRSLVEATSQIIWDTSAAGEFVSEQPRWAQFTGQTYEEYQGWGWLKAIHPEDQLLTAKLWKQALANGSLYEIEYRVRRYDGEYRYLSGRGVPLVEADGKVREWVGINTDITERKQAEAARDSALAEAEAARAELQGVFMQAPAAIATFRGSNHVIETVNLEYLRLVGKGDILGKTVREAFSKSEGDALFELLDEVYRSGEPFVGKEMRVLCDGKSVRSQKEGFWNVVYQPLRDAEGKVYGIMTHAVEVTEQVRSRQEIEKKAEELAHLTQALKRSNQDLDQFAYVTSHDLKAPLRAIANLSEWLEEDLADQLGEDSREHLHLMRKRVHRMGGLIDGILQYSRAGRVEQIEAVNVTTLLSDLIEFLAPPPNIIITVEPGMPTFETEKIPLEQVFMNLLNNAIKYVQTPDAQIQISVLNREEYYEFAVTDNGLGIAPEFHNKIWGIFQRLEARDKVEGTGVGLSIVKKIVESRGGRVWVESELDAGASFCFTWPKQPPARFES
jgi:PAS domain S-box-containing protein